MAEMIKSVGTSKNIDEIKSRVQSSVGSAAEKVSETARDVAGRLQENRPLLFAGIGLVALSLGFGVWRMIRRARAENASFASYGADYGAEDYRRSSQY